VSYANAETSLSDLQQQKMLTIEYTLLVSLRNNVRPTCDICDIFNQMTWEISITASAQLHMTSFLPEWLVPVLIIHRPAHFSCFPLIHLIVLIPVPYNFTICSTFIISLATSHCLMSWLVTLLLSFFKLLKYE